MHRSLMLLVQNLTIDCTAAAEHNPVTLSAINLNDLHLWNLQLFVIHIGVIIQYRKFTRVTTIIQLITTAATVMHSRCGYHRKWELTLSPCIAKCLTISRNFFFTFILYFHWNKSLFIFTLWWKILHTPLIIINTFSVVVGKQ